MIGKRKETRTNGTASPGQFVKIKRKPQTNGHKSHSKKLKIIAKDLGLDESETNSTTQMEKLLIDTKISKEQVEFINGWWEKLKKFTEKLRPQTDKEADDNSNWINKEIYLPILATQLNLTELKYHFKGVNGIHLIGSHSLGTSYDHQNPIDVCVQIPKTGFQSDQYQNMKYHQIRAFYLSYLAMKLSKWKHVLNVKFAFFHDNSFHPIIVVHPKILAVDEIVPMFHIHVVCAEETFKINRLLPSVKNITKDLFRKCPQMEWISNGFSPHYNSSISHDLMMLEYQQFLHNSFGLHENIRNGIILIKKWLKCRGLDRGMGGFSGFIAAMFVAYLLQQKKLHLTMSASDVVRVFWLNLSMCNWHESEQGISFNSNHINLEGFHKHFDCVFVDASGYTNICANLSLEMFLLTRNECKRALNLMMKPQIKTLFTESVPAHLKFDHIVNIKNKANIDNILSRNHCNEYYFDFCCNYYPAIIQTLTRLLRKGLKERIRCIVPITTQSLNQWNIDENRNHKTLISLGICLNPLTAFEVLDKGPQANQPEAEKFKLFWGNKSELRRFQDGVVIEACLWKSPTDRLSEKRQICKEIIFHLLQHHLGIDANLIGYVANQFDLAYQTENLHYLYEDREMANNSEHLSMDVIKSFNELGKCIRSIEDIPLDISSILGISSVFRYTEVQPILSNAQLFSDGSMELFQSYHVNEAIIQFGASGKWPNDLSAIRRVKAALLLQLAKELRTKQNLPMHVNPHNIEVLKDGFVFRFFIALHKELLLTKKERSSKGVVKYRDTKESLIMEKRFFLTSKLNTLLHTLYHNNHSYGPAVMIAKRWLYSQLIDPYLWPDECTELVMAYVYNEDHTLDGPIQPQMAFFRFLNLLQKTDWKNEMLVINLSDVLSAIEIDRIRRKFKRERDTFPCMSIVTSADDGKYSIWTRDAPSRQVLSRVILLSKHVLSIVENSIISERFSSKPFFFASTDGYDVLITLRKCNIPTCYLYDFAKECKRKQFIDETIPAANFRPIQRYLQELREAYSEFAIFFYDLCGGRTIGVLWKPDTFTNRPFNIDGINGMHTINNSSEYVRVNVKQIIEDFRIIGQGLVEVVTVCRDIN